MIIRASRPRRSNLAVPASSLKMLDKARILNSDQVFLDLEDACAPGVKPQARKNIIAALAEDGWENTIRTVRVNDWTSEWTYLDVFEVVSGAGQYIDAIVLPKVQSSAHIQALDLLLTQIEKAQGFEVGRIGIEAQIEDPHGLLNINRIAKASPRLESLIFGPGDFMASVNMKSLTIGEQPVGYEIADAFHHVFMSILLAARANNLQAIDGPFAGIRDLDGFKRTATQVAALGFDGKWVLHPDQIDAANAIFTPGQDEFDRAENLLDAYAWHTSAHGGSRGAATLDGEMIDEASRKLALSLASKGRAAGMSRSRRWAPPEQ